MKTFKKALALLMTVLLILPSLAGMTVFAADSAVPTIRVSNSTAAPGKTAEVTISLENNPGIISMRLFVDYNKEYITLTNVTDAKVLPDAVHGNNYADTPYTLTWSDDTSAENYEVNGTVVTLTFTVAENAPVDTKIPVSISYDPEEIYDYKMDSVYFETVAGSVTIPACEHNMTHHEKVEATCKDNGNEEYWHCSECGKNFADAAGTEVIENVVIPADAKYHTGGEATCVDLAICEVCEKPYGKKAPDKHVGGDGTLYSDEIEHWNVCECEERINIEAHTGGVAYCNSYGYCKVCRKAYIDPIPKNHPVTTPLSAVDATCVDTGVKSGYYFCYACGNYCDKDGNTVSKEEVIIPTDSNNHVGKTYTIGYLAPTCSDDGNTGDTYCSDCNTMIKKGETIPATDEHVDIDGKWETDDENHYHWHTCGCSAQFDKAEHTGGVAYCSTPGYCVVCGGAYIDPNPQNHPNLKPARAFDATCEYTGIKNGYYYCSSCNSYCEEDGTTVSDDEVIIPKDPNNHVGSSGTWGYDENYHWDICAGCDKAIIKAKHNGGEANCKYKAVCDDCKQPYGDVDANNHVGGDEMGYDDDSHWIICACDAPIYTEDHTESDKWSYDEASHWHACEVCEMEMSEKAAHTESEWIVDEEATSRQDGKQHMECTVCGYVLAEETIPATGEEDSGFLEYWKNTVLSLFRQTFQIVAEAGEGGSITDEGKTYVKYGTNKTYYITADEGYEIEAVYVNGKDMGAIDKYTFKNVTAKQKIEAEFAEVESVEEIAVIDVNTWANPFVDVADDADYIDAIEFVYENGLFKGVSENEFAPEKTMTRAMFVTVLGRLAGVNENAYIDSSFEDVVVGEWYAPYVDWAADAGIVLGYGDGTFGVNNEITVEQAAVILARYAEYAEVYEASEMTLEDYADAELVSDWALAAMQWAVENGIYTGTSDELVPQNPAPRALVASMLYSYAVEFEG